MEETTENKVYSYSKRPLWQWVLIYIVIGGIIYGLIYYFVLAKKGGYTTNPTGQYQYPSPTAQQAVSQTTTPTAPATSSAQVANTITLTKSGWSPDTVTITAGQSVTWKNQSGEDATVNSNPHPSHTNYPPLNLGTFSDGGSLTLTFAKAGTYGYHNHLNPSETGTIIVK